MSERQETIYPHDVFKVSLPNYLYNESQVAFSPSKDSPLSNLSPKILQTKNGKIEIENTSEECILIVKKKHVLDVRTVEEVDFGTEIRKLKFPQTNLQPSTPLPPTPDTKYLKDIQIDPDKALSQEWREKFSSVCEQLLDVFNPLPGCYNNARGRVDNSINWAGAAPPPTLKARIPTYSYDMKKRMAKLMDDLEAWGVLKTPEEMGVVPANVAPSMMVPKGDTGEDRLATDFTGRNVHIKIVPHLSPTISEARKQLAKFKYNIHLDLSQYFWQGLLDPKDAKYLATPHPFKGFRVYAREPQGLRNASEHSYERLGQGVYLATFVRRIG